MKIPISDMPESEPQPRLFFVHVNGWTAPIGINTTSDGITLYIRSIGVLGELDTEMSQRLERDPVRLKVLQEKKEVKL